MSMARRESAALAG